MFKNILWHVATASTKDRYKKLSNSIKTWFPLLKGQNKWEYSLDDVYFANAKNLGFPMKINVDHLIETQWIILI